MTTSTRSRRVRIAIPDLISNSYFPIVAACDLGELAKLGLEATVDLKYPVTETYRALRDGEIDIAGGSAHSALSAFPEWRGVRLLAAQGQGMYWFLVVRADLPGGRGELDCLRGKRIGAAPWVDMGLRRLLIAAGLDPAKSDISIVPVPGAGAPGSNTNFGLNAARALEAGKIDGFWANGMGTEVAVRSGAGRVVLDVRRGDGPAGCFGYTFSSIAATEEFVRTRPEDARAVVRALVATHARLRRNPSEATAVGERRFPPEQAALIATLIQRDVPYYDATISPETVNSMNSFARDLELLGPSPVAYEQIVATECASAWRD